MFNNYRDDISEVKGTFVWFSWWAKSDDHGRIYEGLVFLSDFQFTSIQDFILFLGENISYEVLLRVVSTIFRSSEHDDANIASHTIAKNRLRTLS